MNNIRVFFFGDSICVGQFVALHKGWVVKMSARLSELGEKYGKRITVTNASANGRTTRDALERITYEVLSHAPSILIVQFGMNDCNYWETEQGLPRVSSKSFAANLGEIITRGLHFGAKKIYLNTNHPTPLDFKRFPKTEITFQQSNQRYNEIIRQVAADYGSRVTLNDVEKRFFEFMGNDRARLLSLLMPEPDLLHLSEQGHELYFDAIYPSLEKAVLELVEHE